MSCFVFKAKKSPSEELEGSVEAESERSAVNKIISFGYYPVWIKEEDIDAASFSRRVGRGVIAGFTRQLSDLLSSGLTLFDSLLIIEDQARTLKPVVRTIRNNIKKGKAFSESLRSRPDIFSDLYVNLVRSGEAGGILDDTLSNISDLLEKQEDIKLRIINAMLYPALVAGIGIATIFILMIFVIPRLADMFIEMGQALPLSTRILIGLSSFVRDWWGLSGVFIAGSLFLLKRREKTNITRSAIDGLRLKIPVIGCFLRDIELERFSRTLSVLLKNGVPMLCSLKIASDTISNEVIKIDISSAYNDVAAGLSLSAALRKSKYCTNYIVTMTATGEEGGFLDRALLKVAQGYESENDKAIKRFASLLEPVMILVIGILVGFVVISMLLPVFEISISAH